MEIMGHLRYSDYTYEVVYEFIIHSRFSSDIYSLRFFKYYFTEKERDFIYDLMTSKDIDNYKLAKAIIDNKNG